MACICLVSHQQTHLKGFWQNQASHYATDKCHFRKSGNYNLSKKPFPKRYGSMDIFLSLGTHKNYTKCAGTHCFLIVICYTVFQKVGNILAFVSYLFCHSLRSVPAMFSFCSQQPYTDLCWNQTNG